MGRMVLCRTFHTAPEQGKRPEQGRGRMGYIPIFQVLKLFQVVCFNDISMAFRCPVLVPDTTVPVSCSVRQRNCNARVLISHYFSQHFASCSLVLFLCFFARQSVPLQSRCHGVFWLKSMQITVFFPTNGREAQTALSQDNLHHFGKTCILEMFFLWIETKWSEFYHFILSCV